MSRRRRRSAIRDKGRCARRTGHRPTGVDGATAPKILVGKPGLDGHSNGAEQIALRARDVGMEVIYQGIRLTPAEIATSALRRTSTWSASRSSPAPVVVGGIIPVADAERLRAAGVYTPKDFDVNKIMGEIVELVGERAGAGAAA